VTYGGYQIIARFWTGVKIESAQPHQLKNHTVAFGAHLKKFKTTCEASKPFFHIYRRENFGFFAQFCYTYLLPCRGSG
jgi:hypothetical protein